MEGLPPLRASAEVRPAPRIARPGDIPPSAQASGLSLDLAGGMTRSDRKEVRVPDPQPQPGPSSRPPPVTVPAGATCPACGDRIAVGDQVVRCGAWWWHRNCRAAAVLTGRATDGGDVPGTAVRLAGGDA